ncbi:MAG: hypothetical protein ACMXYC_03250 [Candidatus Woesearchaeota archaeon]
MEHSKDDFKDAYSNVLTHIGYQLTRAYTGMRCSPRFYVRINETEQILELEKGLEHIVQDPRARIAFLSSHRHDMDIPLVYDVSKRLTGVFPRIIMKDTLPAQWLLRTFGGVPIMRQDDHAYWKKQLSEHEFTKKKRMQAIKMKQVMEYCSAKPLPFAIFPQGSRTNHGASHKIEETIDSLTLVYNKMCTAKGGHVPVSLININYPGGIAKDYPNTDIDRAQVIVATPFVPKSKEELIERFFEHTTIRV